MYVLVFRHVSMEHLGWIAPALETAGVHARYVDLDFDPAVHGSIGEAAGFIHMGGPMSANDPGEYVRRELGVLETALGGGKPVLGVCLGAQLIARVLGSRVYPNRTPEFGWLPVERTDAGRIDPVFAGFADSESVLHFHNDTFDLPPGATRLAYSKDCDNQAFRYGSNVYGLQFHLEATPEMIREWCTAKENRDALSRLPKPVDPDANASRMRDLSVSAFGTWVELLAVRS